MKHVFTSDYEIAHLWANQAQDQARRSGTNNFYFNRDTIYSYGSHFPIAKLVGKYVLFTTQGYSRTTSKQISTVRGSLSQTQRENIVYVNSPEDISLYCRSNFYRSITKEVEILAKKIPAVKERIAKAHKPEKYILDLTDLEYNVNRLESFAKDYAKSVDSLPEDKHKDGTHYDVLSKKQLSKTIRAFRKDAKLGNMADLKAAILKREKAARIEADKLELELVTKFRNFEINHVYNRSNVTYLRVADKIVQTSRGIQIAFEDAKRLYAAFKAKKLIGQKLDYHTITKVEKETVIAGCHHIPFSEIELAAGILGIAV